MIILLAGTRTETFRWLMSNEYWPPAAAAVCSNYRWTLRSSAKISSRPRPHATVKAKLCSNTRDWLEIDKKLWIGQWHFCLQLTSYSCDYKQKVPLATTSYSSRFLHFQVDPKSTLHLRTFRIPSAATMQPGIREYMPPIDIFVKL